MRFAQRLRSGRVAAAQVQDAAHAPGLRARHRAADPRGPLETEIAARAGLLGVPEVPQDEREIREGADARVALRLVDLVAALGGAVAAERLAQELAGPVEVPQVHVDQPAVDVPFRDAQRVPVALSDRVHLHRELERLRVLASQQVEHPLAADHPHEPIGVARGNARRARPRVHVVHAGGRVAAPRLNGRPEVGEEISALGVVAGLRAALVERLETTAEVLGRLAVRRPLERAAPRRRASTASPPRAGGARPVMGDELGLALGHVGEAAHERVGDLPVEHAPPPAQDPLVGRLLKEHVAELVARRRAADGPQDIVGGELGERRLEVARGQRLERAEQRPVELAARGPRRRRSRRRGPAGGRGAR